MLRNELLSRTIPLGRGPRVLQGTGYAAILHLHSNLLAHTVCFQKLSRSTLFRRMLPYTRLSHGR